MNLQNRRRLTDLESLRSPTERMGRKDSQGVWDGHVHSEIFKVDNQQGPIVQHRELCSMLCGSLDGRTIWGRMDICTCMAESFAVQLKLTTLLISYTPVQNKRFFLKKEEEEVTGKSNSNWRENCFQEGFCCL